MFLIFADFFLSLVKPAFLPEDKKNLAMRAHGVGWLGRVSVSLVGAPLVTRRGPQEAAVGDVS